MLCLLPGRTVLILLGIKIEHSGTILVPRPWWVVPDLVVLTTPVERSAWSV
jgi:hypothetical protein